MQAHFWQLADVEARLNDAIAQLRQQHGLVGDIDCPQQHRSIALLLANGLRAYAWLEDQHTGLLERIGEEYPLPRS
jgi:hypothetical protein